MTTDAAQSETPLTDKMRINFADWKAGLIPAVPEHPDGWNAARLFERRCGVLSAKCAEFERESCTLAERVAALEAELQQYRSLRTDKGAVRVNLLQGLLACPDDLIFMHDTQGPYAKLMAKHATAEQSALAANERAEAAEKRLTWAANELLACDYGDNQENKGVGWIVFGWRDVSGISSVIPPERQRRIYGPSISAAIDQAIAAGPR